MAKFLVVFDISGTLLRKYHKAKREHRELAARGIEPDHRFKQFFIYNRPGLDVLVEFLRTHDADYVLWTTGMRQNAEQMVWHLRSLGLDKYLGWYSQSDCKAGRVRVESEAALWVKDLEVVARAHGVDVERCILVDDSVDKSVHDQNFVCCTEYVPGLKDRGIADICRHLDDFFGCSEQCVAKDL